MSLIHSTAQPSPSGSSSSFSPGKNRATSLAVSRCLRYSIFGPYPGGSDTTSFSSGIERSTMVLPMHASLCDCCPSYRTAMSRIDTTRPHVSIRPESRIVERNPEPPLSGHPRKRRTDSSIQTEPGTASLRPPTAEAEKKPPIQRRKADDTARVTDHGPEAHARYVRQGDRGHHGRAAACRAGRPCEGEHDRVEPLALRPHGGQRRALRAAEPAAHRLGRGRLSGKARPASGRPGHRHERGGSAGAAHQRHPALHPLHEAGVGER